MYNIDNIKMIEISDSVRHHLEKLASSQTSRNEELLFILNKFPREIDFNYPIPNSNYTALTRAVAVDDKHQVKFLTENGADIDLSDQRGNTALIEAVDGNKYKMVRFLINNGANVNQPGSNGDTPLIKSIPGSYESIFNLLIASNVDINQPDGQGDTPIITAIRNNNERKFDTLMANDPDTNQPNNNGETTWKVAKDIQNEYMLTSLKEHQDFNETKYLEEGKDLYKLSVSFNHETIIIDTTTAIGNTADSTELPFANLDQITHRSSAFDSNCSDLCRANLSLGVAISGMVLAAGIVSIWQVFDQRKKYNNSLQATELFQV